MADLLDDVKALLDKDHGDGRILRQILRACEHNEVISNYEKNYVRKLAEKHLGRKPVFVPNPEPTPVRPVAAVPAVSLQSQAYETASPRFLFLRKRKKQMLVAAGALVLILLIGAAAASVGPDTGPAPITPVQPVVVPFVVTSDLASYASGDLISISGTSDAGSAVTLSIEGPAGQGVWSETVPLKGGGKFSTLLIAGGDGWGGPGTYVIRADNGSEARSATFSFA